MPLSWGEWGKCKPSGQCLEVGSPPFANARFGDDWPFVEQVQESGSGSVRTLGAKCKHFGRKVPTLRKQSVGTWFVGCKYLLFSRLITARSRRCECCGRRADGAVDLRLGTTFRLSEFDVAGVVLDDLLAQHLPVDVGVDLGGGDGFVSQHALDGSQIGSALEQMCGEGVA